MKGQLPSKGQIKVMRCLTQGATAWALGMTVQHLREQSNCPRDDVTDQYNLADVVSWRMESLAGAGVGAGEGDEMFGGPSPNLEKYRHFRALQEEIKLAQMRGDRVPADLLTQVFMPVAERFRKRQEALRKRESLTGPEAVEFLQEVLGEMMEAIEPDGGDLPLFEKGEA